MWHELDLAQSIILTPIVTFEMLTPFGLLWKGSKWEWVRGVKMIVGHVYRRDTVVHTRLNVIYRLRTMAPHVTLTQIHPSPFMITCCSLPPNHFSILFRTLPAITYNTYLQPKCLWEPYPAPIENLGVKYRLDPLHQPFPWRLQRMRMHLVNKAFLKYHHTHIC